MFLGVLGGTELTFDGAVVALTPQQRRLLAALAAHGHRTVDRHVLGDAMWGAEQPDDASAALQTVVSRLRARTERGLIETHTNGYSLGRSVVIDVEKFDHLVAPFDGSSTEDRASLLEQALSLWRDDPFVDVPEVDAARFEASRLNEVWWGANEDLARMRLQTGDVTRALALVAPLVPLDPLREGPRSLLMEALYRDGRQPEALREYDAFRMLLADELGLEPSPALRELEAAILNDELESLSPPGVPGRSRAIEASISYVSVDADRIVAVGVIGEGPDLVFMPGWLSNLRLMARGQDPRAAVIHELALHFRVTFYDRFGTGMSSGDPSDFSTEAAAEELEAVLTSIDASDVTVVASSGSGPSGILAASRSTMSRLVLFGTFADGPAVFPNQEVRASLLQLVRQSKSFGFTVFANLLAADSETPDVDRLGQYLRESAPPETAAGYLDAMYDADVTGVLDQITVPVLVVHYEDDRAIPFAGGVALARSMRGAELVSLEGRHHLPPPADAAMLAQRISDFALRD